ncbi:MAG: hypothetical protein WEB67_11520, partial [Acidimicrobiia bacterium]
FVLRHDDESVIERIPPNFGLSCRSCGSCGGLTVALQALVVAMAVTVGVVWCIAVFYDANVAGLERPGRSGITGPEHPSIMHLAMLAPPVDGPVASVDIAIRRHPVKVPNRWDSFSVRP